MYTFSQELFDGLDSEILKHHCGWKKETLGFLIQKAK